MNWMQALASHYEARRKRVTKQPLAIVFDIDGTIFDGRHLLLEMLQAFDQLHGSACARRLSLERLNVHESRLPRLLEQLGEPPARCAAILDFHRRYRWSTDALLRAHRPYHGVLEVIRWFQMQPGTVVALNTGRPEALRLDTLHSLNRLGERFRVHFTSQLLHMNSREDGQSVAEAKVEGIHRLRAAGYGIAAVIDNEPDNLSSICAAHPDEDILPVHAAIVFRSKRHNSPPGTVRGNTYDITSLMTAQRLPRHVQLVWEGIDEPRELHRFLASEIRWADCGWCPSPRASGQHHARLLETMRLLAERGRRLRIRIRSVDEAYWLANAAGRVGLPPRALWVTARLEDIGQRGWDRIADRVLDAVRELDASFVVPLAHGMPAAAAELIERLMNSGVNRFSLPWQAEALPTVMDLFDRLDAAVHLAPAPDLESFLRASLLQPRSIGARFDFPDWQTATGRPVETRYA